MPKTVFWGVWVACLFALIAAVCVFGTNDALFPGLLALFSFSATWTTLDFQLWTKRNADSLRYPRPILLEGTVSVDAGFSKCDLKVSFSNPGDVPIFVRSVRATLPNLVPNETKGENLVVKHYCGPEMLDHPGKAIEARGFGRIECFMPIPNEIREKFWEGAIPPPSGVRIPSASSPKDKEPFDPQVEQVALCIDYISGSRDEKESFQDLKIDWDEETKSCSFRPLD